VTDGPLGFLSECAREALGEFIDRRVEEAFERMRARDEDAANSPYLTIPEAAELLRCSRQRVDDLLSQRRLRRFKDGSRTLVARAEIECYLEARAPAATGARRKRIDTPATRVGRDA
jgi:excisionase family DNA binding protein